MPSDVLERVRNRRRLPDPLMRRAIREAAGATQDEVAQATDVSRRSVVRWEAGLSAPRGDRLTRYLRVLDELRGMQ
jgi:DNA-binding XRE family transcriptional regulator